MNNLTSHKQDGIYTCLLNVIFVSRTKSLVLRMLVVPRALFALKNIALSGKVARTKAANKDIPDAHQNRLRQLEVVSGTRVQSTTAGDS